MYIAWRSAFGAVCPSLDWYITTCPILSTFTSPRELLYLIQGVSYLVLAPTLLDIAHQFDVSVAILSIILLVRAIGSVVGTIGSGILMDRFPRLQYIQLSIITFGCLAGIYMYMYKHAAALID